MAGYNRAITAIAVVALFFIFSYYLIHHDETQINATGKNDSFISENDVKTEKPQLPENTSVSVIQSEEGIRCENCHLNPKRSYVPQADRVKPHLQGGKYCYNCHGSKVHEIHLGEGTINLDCKTCHGVPPKVPEAQEGHVVCEVCHGFPNPLEPSNGNLIKIHLSRGIYCTECHAEGFLNIHVYKK